MTNPLRWAWALLLSAAPLLSGSAASAQVMDQAVYTFLQLEELEFVPGAASEPVSYDGQAWIGGDYKRLWLRLEGEHATAGFGEKNVEGQALFSRLISPFWDVQAGLRVDHRYGAADDATRFLLVAGFEGLAPYWFELTPALFVSEDGDVSARLTARYEVLVTQRLILEPDLEFNVALQDAPEWGVGAGLNDIDLAARLRYELKREFAPYVGWSWRRLLGETADLARGERLTVSEGSFVAGLRVWY